MQETCNPSGMLTLDELRNRQFWSIEDLAQLYDISQGANYALSHEPNLSREVKGILSDQSSEAMRCFNLALVGIYPQNLFVRV